MYYNDNHFRKINIYDENNKLISDFKLHSDSLDFHDFDDVYIDLIKEQIIVYPVGERILKKCFFILLMVKNIRMNILIIILIIPFGV